MFERIIVPMDGSRLSAEAIPYAVSIAQNYNSEVVLLRVVSKPPINLMTETNSISNSLTVDLITEQAETKEVENTAHAKRYLMNRGREVKEKGVNVSYEVMEGSPAHAIMEFAKNKKATLIVMMSHGRGRIKAAILGSVTSAIIHGSTVPVLVIRPKDLLENN